MSRVQQAVHARLRGERDAGTTIVELSVVMVILAFIVAATVTLANGFERSNAENTNRQDQLDTARMAVERMSTTLRTAVKPSQLRCEGCTDTDAFVQGQDFQIQFYANFHNPNNSVGPSRVTYTVATTGAEAGTLTEKVQIPDSPVPSPNYAWCNAEAPTASADCKARLTTRVLARGVALGRPLFTYYPSTCDTEPTAANTCDSMPLTAGALTSSQLEKLLSVEVMLTVQSTAATKPNPTTYVERILFPNSDAILRPPESD